MVEINAGAILVTFVASAFIATFLKNSGGPFRTIFTFILVIGIGGPFLASYAKSAPAMVAAIVIGGIIGLKT